MTRRPGPWVWLMVVRRAASRTGYRTEWLSSPEHRSEAMDVAAMLVNDPRDCVDHVCLWDDRREQFVAVVR